MPSTYFGVDIYTHKMSDSSVTFFLLDNYELFDWHLADTFHEVKKRRDRRKEVTRSKCCLVLLNRLDWILVQLIGAN